MGSRDDDTTYLEKKAYIVPIWVVRCAITNPLKGGLSLLNRSILNYVILLKKKPSNYDRCYVLLQL